MKKEVKYDNIINSLQFKKFTTIDYNLFMFLCQEMKNQGSAEKTFTFKYIKAQANFGNHTDKMLIDKLDKMADKLTNISGRIETEDKIFHLNFFDTFEIDKENKTFTVSVNKDCLFLLNDISEKFTSFELQEFVELDGKYSKALYMRFKQYKFNGWWNPTIEDMRICLDIPSTYKPKDIMKDIVKPSIIKLSPYFDDIECEPINAKKKGSPIERYSFTWKAEEYKKDEKTINNIPKARPKTNNFNNFPQNEYDFEELEKQICENY